MESWSIIFLRFYKFSADGEFWFVICGWFVFWKRISIHETYRKTSNISRTLVGNKIADNSDVVGASPVGVAPTTSSFST